MDLVVLEDPRIQAPSSAIQVTENLTIALFPEAIVIIEISRMVPGLVVEYRIFIVLHQTGLVHQSNRNLCIKEIRLSVSKELHQEPQLIESPAISL